MKALKGLIIVAILLSVPAYFGYKKFVKQAKTHKSEQPVVVPKDVPAKDKPDNILITISGPDHVEMPRPGVISKYDKMVRKYARRYLFDWRLISAQIYAESRFRYTAESYCGALGLMQIMPGTAQWLEGKAHKETPELKGVSQALLEPEANIHLGCYYDAMLLTRIKNAANGNERQKMMLGAYNAGPGNLNKARKKSNSPKTWNGIKKHMPEETRNYIPIIYDRYEVYKKWAILKPY